MAQHEYEKVVPGLCVSFVFPTGGAGTSLLRNEEPLSQSRGDSSPLSSCQLCLIAKYCQDELPAWIIKFHEISYFAAVLGPSFYPIIFNGTGLLYFQCQVIEKFSY